MLLPPGVRRGDFWSGLALAGLGTYIAQQAWGWDYTTPDGPGAGFFPLWYGIAMIALSLALVVSSVRRRTASSDVRARLDPGVPRALACLLALVVAIALL